MSKRNRKFTTAQKAEIFDKSGGRCRHCSVVLGELWHADHIIAHSDGGPTEVYNGQALCPACNLEKSALSDEAAREKRAFRRRMRADVVSAAATAGSTDGAFLARAFERLQKVRVSFSNADSAAGRNEKPSALQSWLTTQLQSVENDVADALEAYAMSTVVGQWAMSHVGVGPKVAGQLVGMVDITRAPTAGSLWRYAGLDPSSKWGKGQKRPHNARLKTVVVEHLTESLVKTWNRPDAFYGRLMKGYKDRLVAKNERGEFASEAARILRDKPTHAQRETYAAGMLPASHIHRRAKRWVAKLFLSHYHEVAYFAHHGEMPPKPYSLAHLDHAHKIEVPNWPWARKVCTA